MGIMGFAMVGTMCGCCCTGAYATGAGATGATTGAAAGFGADPRESKRRCPGPPYVAAPRKERMSFLVVEVAVALVVLMGVAAPEEDAVDVVVEEEALGLFVEVGEVFVVGEAEPFLLAVAARTFSSISVEDLRSLAVSSVRVAGLGEVDLVGSVDHGWNLFWGGDPTAVPSAARFKPLSTGEEDDVGLPGCLMPGGCAGDDEGVGIESAADDDGAPPV